MASGNSSTWLLYKQLLNVVNLAVFGRSEEIYHDLEALLRRHKPAFLTLAEPLVSINWLRLTVCLYIRTCV